MESPKLRDPAQRNSEIVTKGGAKVAQFKASQFKPSKDQDEEHSSGSEDKGQAGISENIGDYLKTKHIFDLEVLQESCPEGVNSLFKEMHLADDKF